MDVILPGDTKDTKLVKLSTSSESFCKLDSQSHDISILIFEIQVILNEMTMKLPITCFLEALLVEKKTP